jgi:hypothetical protein
MGMKRGKAFNMLFFFFQERHRNEQWEGGIAMPGFLEAFVEGSLDVFP